jgi:NAD-specific glutamate dehydrogenase
MSLAIPKEDLRREINGKLKVNEIVNRIGVSLLKIIKDANVWYFFVFIRNLENIRFRENKL